MVSLKRTGYPEQPEDWLFQRTVAVVQPMHRALERRSQMDLPKQALKHRL
jgi:hypothetical protein